MNRLQSVFVLGLLLLAGCALRLWLAIAAYTSTFDTGTVALMAMDIAQGNDFPLFFYGQSYFGALEAYVAASLIKIVGHHELVVASAVIAFSLLWILATYLLFSELFDDRKAGWVAAGVVALPGYQIAWYNVASYGGYPAAYAIGTLVLWLAVVINKREPVGREAWGCVLLFALLAGLGVWIHLSVAPFILVSGGLLIRTVHRENIKIYLVGALIAGLGLIPGLMMSEVYTGSDTAKFVWAGEHLSQSLDILFKKNLPSLLFWKATVYSEGVEQLANGMTGVSLVGAVLVFGYACFRKRSLYLLVPLAFVILFLCLYLPHQLATVKAPRYIMPAFVIVVCTLFAYPVAAFERRGALLSALLPLMFVLAQVVGTLAFAEVKRPVKELAVSEARATAEGASALGCDYVQVIGGYIYGHLGQKYSFFSKGRSRFVSVFDERHQASAQRADAAAHPGYLCEEAIAEKVETAFQQLGFEQVQVSNRVYRATTLWRAPRAAVENLQPAELFDRDRSTGLEGQCRRDALLIDLGQSRKLTGLWMTSLDFLQAGVPESYKISISEDGSNWKVIAECASRIAVSYRSGPQAYFKGYYGMQEIAFSGMGRHLKIEFGRGQGATAARWSINELVVFEAGKALGRPRADGLNDWLREQNASFVVADRWLSARLIEAFGPGFAFPRYNPKYLPSQQPRDLESQSDLVIAVDEGLVEETRRLIGADRIVAEAGFGTYYLFACTLPDGLYWNGHFLSR